MKVSIQQGKFVVLLWLHIINFSKESINCEQNITINIIFQVLKNYYSGLRLILQFELSQQKHFDVFVCGKEQKT